MKTKEKECKFCYKKFKPTKKYKECCGDDCQNKYNNYLANDNTEKPWDKLTI